MRRFGFLLLVSLAIVSVKSSAADESQKNVFTFKVGYSGTATARSGDEFFPREKTVVFADQFSGSIEVRPERSADGVTWYPKGDALEIEGSVSETETVRARLTGEGGVQADETTVTAYRGYPVCPANLVNTFVKIRAKEKLYDLQFTLMPDMAATMESVLQTTKHDVTGAPSLDGGRVRKAIPSQNVPLDMGPGQMSLGFSNYSMVVDLRDEPLGDATVLSGTKRLLLPKPAGWRGAWDLGIDVEWKIDVSLPPLELILTVPEYEQWRPETTPDREKGPPLEVTATLVTPKGGKPTVRVERFIWELKETSSEPGVALNYPRDVSSTEFDLELDAGGSGFVLSEKNQRMERRVSDGYSDSAKVVPYDWGGWSTLQVTAVLVDGRRVTGKLKGKSERGLRIPKRDPDSHIADAWKTKNNRGADDLDDENEPVGDGNKGDGFTLYEEYRGFVIQGEHVEGSPEAKDFFVLNWLGEDGKPGIELFESLSGFRVHTTELAEEISSESRVMNGNHRAGAHLKRDQHAVFLAYAENASALAEANVQSYGAKTVAIPNTHGVAFRPGLTKIIGILPRGHAESLFTVPGYLPVEDAIFTFDRAIAHELMHSVGVVEHGGASDGQLNLVFVSPKNSANSQGRAYFANVFSKFEPVEILDENKHDVAAQIYVQWAAAKAEWMDSARNSFVGKPGDADYPRRSEEGFEQIAEGVVGGMLGLEGLVGAEHGPHSGNQDCIMRYHFARFYPMQGQPKGKGFYMIVPGAERIGLELCTSTEGTGVNADGRQPQSRHGAAAKGGGNCAAQICPNDNVPPRPSAF